jgi:hypothetical protein
MAAEQNQPVDANSRLKQRMRATVPPRDTSVLKRQSKEEEATAPETEKLSETLSKPTEKEKKWLICWATHRWLNPRLE